MKKPIRAAVFGSYYRGISILEAIKSMDSSKVVVTGIATDDPKQSYVSPGKRLWQYPYSEEESLLVQAWGKSNNISVWNKRVKSEAFYDLYFKEWKPDICFMGTFGQKINPKLFEYPDLGFYNFHPCVQRKWPSYVGGNPFQEMMSEGEEWGVIAMHKVDAEWDNGHLITTTQKYPIYKADSVANLHKRSAPLVGDVVKSHIASLYDEHNALG